MYFLWSWNFGGMPRGSPWTTVLIKRIPMGMQVENLFWTLTNLCNQRMWKTWWLISSLQQRKEETLKKKCKYIHQNRNLKPPRKSIEILGWFGDPNCKKWSTHWRLASSTSTSFKAWQTLRKWASCVHLSWDFCQQTRGLRSVGSRPQPEACLECQQFVNFEDFKKGQEGWPSG